MALDSQPRSAAAVAHDLTVEGFLESLAGESLSPATLSAYRTALARFAEFLAPRSAWPGSDAEVGAFLAYLGQLGVSPKSLEAYKQVLARWMAHVAASRPPLPAFGREQMASALGGVRSAEPSPDSTILLPAAGASAGFEPVVSRPSLLDGELGWSETPERTGDQAGHGAMGAEAATATVPAAAETPEPSSWSAMPPVEATPAPAAAWTPAAAHATTLPPAAPVDPVRPPDPSAGWSVAPGEEWSAPSSPGPSAQALLDEGKKSVAKIIKTAPLPPMPDEAPTPAPTRRASKREADAAARLAQQGITPPKGVASATAAIPLASEGVRKAPVAVDPDIVALGDDVSATPRAPILASAPEGWTLRRGLDYLPNLDLGLIRDMARGGEVNADDQIKRPGGDWVRVADYPPLRSILDQRRVEQEHGARFRRRTSVPSSAPKGAVAGIVAALAVAAVWWLLSTGLGLQMAPMAVLAGILGGRYAREASRGMGVPAGLIGAFAPWLALVVQRYLALETASAGVDVPATARVGLELTDGLTEPFLAGSLVIGTVLGFVLGARSMPSRPR